MPLPTCPHVSRRRRRASALPSVLYGWSCTAIGSSWNGRDKSSVYTKSYDMTMKKTASVSLRRRPKPHMVAAALTSAALVGCSADAALFGNSRMFRWNASLDRITGEATATETSIPRRPRRAASPKYAPSVCDEKSLIELLKAYPAWLSKPSVSFGLLRTSTLSEADDVSRNRIDRSRAAQTDSASGVSINSLFGLNLLCFGEPRVSIMKSKASDSGRCRSFQADFPVIGGLLDGKRDATYSSSKNTNEHGCIRFVVEQEEIRDGVGDGKQRDRRCWRIVRLESCICDGYHPAIAGAVPVNPIRKAAYLSSQSLIHAYVMWRFHGMVLTECETECIICS